MGVPTLTTTYIIPAKAGQFYLAWILASLLGNVSVAVANSVLALSLGSDKPALRLAKILLGLLFVLGVGGLIGSIGLPGFLTFITGQYLDVPEIFKILSIGQLFFGVSVVSLAAFRSLMLKRQLVAILVGWPFVVISGVVVGLVLGGSEGGAFGFTIGNLLASVPIGVLTFWSVYHIKIT
jgi:hypothetical protein